MWPSMDSQYGAIRLNLTCTLIAPGAWGEVSDCHWVNGVTLGMINLGKDTRSW